jgi:hypothetical protein
MREIIDSDNFREAVRVLGGHRAIDEALEPIIEALFRNPYEFPYFENDWVRFRYARTRPIRFVRAGRRCDSGPCRRRSRDNVSP